MNKIEKARQLANLGKPKEIVGAPMITERTFGEAGNQVTLTLKPLSKKEYKYVDPDESLPIPKPLGLTVGDYIEILKKFDVNAILLHCHEACGFVTLSEPLVIDGEEIDMINEEDYEGTDKFVVIT